ncbi:MAG: aspartyl/glutamyl-tRNA amidotransferase subunit A [Candidatus Yonathbacteria bacterium RIFOXYC1_FULL_52_10]|uniref:Glutamyl-tRNA(Gln) amidotransferase subunit A n=1 Tax=Candidatus Yonathbacteria bacterium RIFOXYD1_FULL_52_36 TaxID=1802730 RepID=A0A1G2SJB2_9BACT|nr:MAG: aspartyl/glutamyl-tRNA amidotransferase subunit A [Candidatus Yonathbacteria bacterium RIFOXYC1_FULL_52_10]OHA84832.1 MAG: aspartyl/glutamyl-tRNA amidotransferase subunit A [Candidatus Yonathbacteria bacterium RIFOXYD1_FULL_52_36]
MAIDPKQLTIAKAAAHLAHKDFSAEELTQAYLDAAEKKNPEINAYLELFSDARDAAKAADARRAKGETNPLLGIPLAMKDNILIKGKHASSASKILETYVAPYDATATKRLKDAGAVFLGRTNMDEFAMGGSTENSAFGPTKNPHDTTRVPGGSSGGSAAVVAADIALGSLGSDTGGSIRQPASFCGVVGLKPTYGAVSRFGLMAMASSLDQIGPFAKNVEDTEILFNAIKGNDPLDSTSAPDARFASASGAKTKLRIGVPESFAYGEGVDPEVVANFKETLAALAKAGHEIVPIELSHITHSLAVYYILMPAEASTNLARYDGVRFGMLKEGAKLFDDYAETRGAGFGREVRRRILLGAYVLSSGYYDAYYHKATAVRAMIEADFARAFTDVDIIATPTAPTPAFAIGEKSSDPLQMYLADIFTVPANLAGVPGISVPSGSMLRDGKMLPLGIQFLAPHFREDMLFAAGKSVEEHTQ